MLELLRSSDNKLALVVIGDGSRNSSSRRSLVVILKRLRALRNMDLSMAQEGS